MLRLAFTLIAFLHLAATAMISIDAGDGGLVFKPSTVTAAVGDQVHFSFYPGDHSVAQSAFDAPCQPLNGGMGFWAGQFFPTQSKASSTFVMTINSTDPMYFYCPQQSHCQSGMVGIINPAQDHSVADFQKAAESSSNNQVPNFGIQGGVIEMASSGASSSSHSSVSLTRGIWPTRLVLAHGIMMSVNFVLLLPLASVLARAVSVRTHYIMQAINLCVIIAAFGIAVYMSSGQQLQTSHQRLGLVVFILLFLQAFSGFFHHAYLHPKTRKGCWYHRYFGRIVILLGMTNAYLGIQLATDERWPTGVYWAITGFVVLAASCWIVFRRLRRSNSLRRNKNNENSQSI